VSACVVAEMAAWAIEQHPVDAVAAAGLDEAERVAGCYGLGPGTVRPIRQAASGTLGPYRAGMALDAVATVASVMLVLRASRGLRRR